MIWVLWVWALWATLVLFGMYRRQQGIIQCQEHTLNSLESALPILKAHQAVIASNVSSIEAHDMALRLVTMAATADEEAALN